MFIKEFLNYIEFERRFSVHTISSYTKDLEQFFDFLFKTYKIEKAQEIDFVFIRSWIALLMEEGNSPRTVNRKISTLKSYFRYLLKIGKIDQNPVLKITGPKVRKKLPVFIEEKSMNLLITEFGEPESFEQARDRLVVELFYATGIRRAELIGLKINDINLEKGLIKVLGKRNKERLIPVHNNLFRLIDSYLSFKHTTFSLKAQDEFFFLTIKGTKMYPKLVYRIVNNYLSRVSTQKKKSPHVLRHTFATHMLNHGADLNAVKELLGHANLAATQIYTHNTIEKLKNIYKLAHPKA
ncbi:MAG: tyrosine-type recombinase/integrase [Bacteroidales bacterium]|jgi:integrase/recombinase XerC|nr:tyrosine-type recombinase/integrase [Bacteroidales bacterium]